MFENKKIRGVCLFLGILVKWVGIDLWVGLDILIYLSKKHLMLLMFIDFDYWQPLMGCI